MTFNGHIENGQVVFDSPLNLPDGTAVTVVVGHGKVAEHEEDVPTIFEQLKPFIGKIEGLPEDTSQNIDHYLYGHPKN
jgi:hypothetical protein